jgi:hypothetical protein
MDEGSQPSHNPSQDKQRQPYIAPHCGSPRAEEKNALKHDDNQKQAMSRRKEGSQIARAIDFSRYECKRVGVQACISAALSNATGFSQ